MINFNTDSHIHTSFSPDADPKATFQEYIKEAKKKNLNQLIFTDHVDFDAVHPLFHKLIDYDTYIQTFHHIKQNTQFQIKLGVEIGYQPQVKKQINDFIGKYPFEHVILSIHYIDNQDLYTKEYFQNKTEQEYISRYFELLLDAVTNIDDFDVVGHFDYITRYSEKEDYIYEDYKDIIDKILTVIVQKNKGIECNTSGYQTDKRLYPKKEIIQRFLELGGRNITIGSDAHNISELGRYFDQTKKELHSILKKYN